MITDKTTPDASVFYICASLRMSSSAEQTRQLGSFFHTVEAMDQTQDLFDTLGRKLRIRQERTVLGIDVAPLDTPGAGCSWRVDGARISGAGLSHNRNRAAPTPLVVNRRRRWIRFDESDEPRDGGVVNLFRRGMDPREVLVHNSGGQKVMQAVDGLDQVLRRLPAAQGSDLRTGDQNPGDVFGRHARLPRRVEGCFDRRMELVRARHEFNGHVGDDVPLLAEVASQFLRIDLAAAENR